MDDVRRILDRAGPPMPAMIGNRGEEQREILFAIRYPCSNAAISAMFGDFAEPPAKFLLRQRSIVLTAGI